MVDIPQRQVESTIRVLVIANFEMVQQALKVLVSANRDISVTGTISFFDDISHPESILDSDVAILYYAQTDRMEIISTLRAIQPGLRIVVIVEREDLDSQLKAIKLGAVGIVQKEQSPKLLIEAIRQTYNGETWLNQTILNKVLVSEHSGKGKPANVAHVKNPDALTPRELEVTRMLGNGLKNKDIAKRLAITEATVRHHLSSIYGKLGVDDRLNLIIFAHQNGLIELSPKNNDHH